MSGYFRGNWSSTSNSNQHLPNQNQSKIHEDQTGTTEQVTHPYDSIIRADPINRQMVTGYTRLVTDRVEDGWTCHLLTATFSQLPGPRAVVIQSMKDELARVYSTFITRVHRKPRSASTDELPFLIGVADLPVHKRDRTTGPLVLCNGGLHFHNLLLVPPETRLDLPVEQHFHDHEEMYLGRLRLISHLDVQPVIEGHECLVDYSFKTVLRGRVPYDEAVLVLPRTRGEVARPARFGPSRAQPFTRLKWTGVPSVNDTPSLR